MGLKDRFKNLMKKIGFKSKTNKKRLKISEPLSVISSNKEINEKYIFKGKDINKVYNIGKTNDMLKPVDENKIQKSVKIDEKIPKKETKGQTLGD